MSSYLDDALAECAKWMAWTSYLELVVLAVVLVMVV